MDWQGLLKLLPLVAGSVNPLAGVVAQAIQTLAEEEIRKRQLADPAKTREEIIAEAGEAWESGLDQARVLRQKGHE